MTDPSEPATPRELLRTVGLALLLAFGIRTGVAQAYVVEGPSMEPTVREGERLIVARCAYGLSVPFVADALVSWAEPHVGDVVVLQSPADGEDLVKRVIGVAGDTIAIDQGVVMRNGVAVRTVEGERCAPERQIDPSDTCRLARESVAGRSWTISRSEPSRLESMAPVVVPAGHVFVLGDHRDRSNDSRFLGPISVTRLRGRVLDAD